ncbi:MAG: autotransporter domain-containing protein [Thiohalomonadales bacterium]
MKKIFVVALIFWVGECLAVVNNVVVSTDFNSVRIIDLSSSITDAYTIITLGNEQGGELPANGFASISGTQITYTPQNGFIGIENFKYSVFDNTVLVATANISINVGSASVEISVANTPSEAISDTLNLVCFSQAGSPSSTALIDLCSDFLNVNATAGELEALLEELAPKEIDGQNYLSATIAANQIDNVRKRLAALRQGTQGIDVTRFSLRMSEQKSFNMASLFEKLPDNSGAKQQSFRGGGASADSLKSSPWGIFFGGNVGGGKHDESENVDGYKFSTYGLNVGLDYRVGNNSVIGGAFGFNTSDMDIDNAKGDLSVDGGSIIAYATYFASQSFYVESILARYQNIFESNRIIDYDVQGMTNSLTAKGETENSVLSFSLGVGYEFYFQSGFRLNLSSSADYIKSTFDGYAESGAGGANLLVSEREQDILLATIDIQMSYAKSFRSGVLIPQWGVAWKHDFDDQPNKIEAIFFGDPSNTPIVFNTDNPETDYFKVNLGVSWIYTGGGTIFVNADTTLGQKDFSDYNLSTGVRLEF